MEVMMGLLSSSRFRHELRLKSVHISLIGILLMTTEEKRYRFIQEEVMGCTT